MDMTREELRKKLPHGALKEVAVYARVSSNAVYKYFNNRINSYKIEIAALNIAAKYCNRKNSIIRQIQDE